MIIISYIQVPYLHSVHKLLLLFHESLFDDLGNLGAVGYVTIPELMANIQEEVSQFRTVNNIE
jgi:hypothetical protein